jgi:hypothetical protein
VFSTDNFSTLNAPYFFLTVKPSALIFCQANQRVISEVIFAVNGQLSTHIFAILSHNGQLSALNSLRTTDQINRSYILKVLVTCPVLGMWARGGVFIRAGHAQLFFESAIAIPQLEGITSAIAIPQLFKAMLIRNHNSAIPQSQFFLKSATSSPQLESFISTIFDIFSAVE